MSPLTPAAIADLQAFAAMHGATYLTTPDPVHPHAPVAPLERHHLRRLNDCRLGDGIRRNTSCDAFTQYRCNIHDRTRLFCGAHVSCCFSSH